MSIAIFIVCILILLANLFLIWLCSALIVSVDKNHRYAVNLLTMSDPDDITFAVDGNWKI